MTYLRLFFLPALIGAAAIACFAQPNRIPSRIDTNRMVTLPGKVHPLANAANDRGAVQSSFPLALTLLLKPSAEQQSSLEQLLQQQQNPSSSSYHQWLTPEQYADRFGVSASDMAQITAWLQTQGFTVDQPARSRTFVTFGATAGQFQTTFGASIHRYQVNGETHFANASNPRIPASLSGVVAGFRGIHDFVPKPHLKKTVLPQYTVSGQHELAPDDFATIYDITPLYSSNINGTGQSIAVMGQSALYSTRTLPPGSDITAFWSKFGITGAKLVQTLATPGSNPGVVSGDVDESNLDIEWSSAVARGATIQFVYSSPAAGGVWQSAQYAVDNDVAPILTISYGNCELYDLVDLPSERQLVQQANSEGITWLAAAGDSGAADCDFSFTPDTVAEGGLAADVPGVIPEVTSMGGTEFNEGSGTYWKNTNSATFESATGYIPEMAWNETSLSYGLAAGGGGASSFFTQPSWQTTSGASLLGVPQDGWRHVPDIAFTTAAHDGYYFETEGQANLASGTSAAAPTMAGVVALLNQSLGTSGLGNINPVLYRLAQTTPAAFHDVTVGSNSVPCGAGSPGCVNGYEGYNAVAGYDQATGLGSVDVTQLVQHWNSGVTSGTALLVPSICSAVTGNPGNSCGASDPVFAISATSGANQFTFQLTLTEEAGVAATLTGFTINNTSYASQIASIFGTSAIAARQSITGTYTLTLTTVPANETLGFSGTDANGNPWSAALTVPFDGPQTQITVAGASNSASGQQVFAPGMIMSIYGTGLGTLAQSAATLPLPEYMAGFEAYICPTSCNTGTNYPVPLYYVGPNQVNLQIPYEVTGKVDLSVGNPYMNTDYYFTVSAAAPGIFTYLDGTSNVTPTYSVGPGQISSVYVTGVGTVSPSLADGVAPSATQTPKPRQTVTITVGGVPVTSIPYMAIPTWSVGVLQINFTVPANVPSGRQPVIVTVGTTASAPAYLTIQ